jgi:hypothetical protein
MLVVVKQNHTEYVFVEHSCAPFAEILLSYQAIPIGTLETRGKQLDSAEPVTSRRHGSIYVVI